MNLRTLPDFQKQFIKFVLIGILAVLVDLACYYTFLHIYPEKMFGFIANDMSAKSTSFICGSLVTYNLNKYWTWKQSDKNNKRLVNFYILYILSMFINVIVNSGMLHFLILYPALSFVPKKYLVAFIVATGVSALLNFFGQKWWIFKEKE
ncbi:MAG: GtrA family protein [Brumimicrobium sp.]|nr:GtrA family protein [Brumimicrobium sp.]MCO5269648.1 GtrA family protein [Brumimicrobium sp.]